MADAVIYSDVQFKQNPDHKDDGKGINAHQAKIEEVTYSEIKTGHGKLEETHNASKGRVPAPTSPPTGSSPGSISAASPSPQTGLALKCALGTLACLCVLLLGLAFGPGLFPAPDQTDQLRLSLDRVSRLLANITVQFNNTLDQLQECLTNVSRLKPHVAKGKGCADGWTHHQGSCYFFSRDQLTWDQSQYACIADGGHLVIIKTDMEQI